MRPNKLQAPFIVSCKQAPDCDMGSRFLATIATGRGVGLQAF